MNSGDSGNNKIDFARVEEITKILAKYEFIDVVKKTGLKNTFNRVFRSKKLEEELNATNPERILLVFEELGTTFIKFGQILSTRPDIVGPEITNELMKLQDQVPTVSSELIIEELESELGSPVNELFLEFDEVAFASASISQVHKAKLHDGTIVAVKIQRPNIIGRINKDITIMRYLGGFLERRISNLKYYNVSAIIDEFERAIIKELDYALEARSIDKFRTLFKDNNHICAPNTYKEYCTTKVLTMDYIDGIKINELPESGLEYDGKKLAKLGAECYFRQIFEYNFFHADPHHGNFLVKEGNIMCFIDFGMMGHLDNDFVDDLTELFVYMTKMDVNAIVNQLVYMNIISYDTDIRALKYDIIDILDEYVGAEIKNLGGVINEFSTPDLMQKYNIKLPRDFILLGKVLTMLESLGRNMDPNFNAFEVTEPLIKKLLKKRLNPLNILDYQTEYLFDLQHLIKDLPQAANEMLLKAKRGEIGVELELKELDNFTDKLEMNINRLSIALLISSLIIGSSLILQSGRGIPIPTLGFSTTGTIIFLFAVLFAMIYVINILRKH
ncbi:MAG: ABC1 kinase family protein [Methanobacterium sp.]|jgi:ubiquinone biosynthesis protein